MPTSKLDKNKKNPAIIKRRQQRVVGVFIDGVGLDHATNRLKRKVDLTALVRGVTAGADPQVARYYTIIPFEDDSRHRAFLDAVRRAGLEPVVKRLPPKGVGRQVSVDLMMSSDLMAFALGSDTLPKIDDDASGESSNGNLSSPPTGIRFPFAHQKDSVQESSSDVTAQPEVEAPPAQSPQVVRIVTVVCPSRELSYPISLIRELGVDTVTADFGRFSGNDILKSSAKWIDLSDSETIWKE